MARIRTIKPSFFRSEDVAALPLRARLLWIGLWTQCDDQGRTKDNKQLIKADVWPLDPVSLAEIEEDLETLAAHGRIVRYEVDGRRYLEITNWGEHQSINRPTPSKIPAPDGSYPQASPHGSLSEDSPLEGKGKEGKGRDARAPAKRSPPARASPDEEPPQKCPKHLDNPNPPNCGPCKDARLTNQQWHADRRARIAALARCPHHPEEPAANCGPCRSERIAAA